jgi:hypothetical protein
VVDRHSASPEDDRHILSGVYFPWMSFNYIHLKRDKEDNQRVEFEICEEPQRFLGPCE